MNAIRSFIFGIIFNINTLFWSVILLPMLLFPYGFAVWSGRIWAQTSRFWMWAIMGISYRVEGRENVPQGAAIIASQHQSAWETIMFYLLVKKPTYILKKELTYIPIWGWYFFGLNMIPIDRRAGASAVKKMTLKSCERLEKGHQIVIFPEGTRMMYGVRGTIHSGFVSIYNKSKLPLTPVTLNSGAFWPKKGQRKPGQVVVTFHPPIEAGLKKTELISQLSDVFYDGLPKAD